MNIKYLIENEYMKCVLQINGFSGPCPWVRSNRRIGLGGVTNNGFSQEPTTLTLSLFQNVKNTYSKTNFWSYPLIHYKALFGYLILAFISHFCILVLLLILITLHLSIFLSPKTNNITNRIIIIIIMA